MKKFHLLVFSALIGSLLLVNSVWSKTVAQPTHPTRDGNKVPSPSPSLNFSPNSSPNFSDVSLLVFLTKTGGLRWISLETQGVRFRISSDGQLLEKRPDDKSLPIRYTDASNQHISQVGDISILYTDTSYQHIRQVGDISILYGNTSYQNVRQVGDVVVQYRNTSYQEIIQVVDNQPNVAVQVER